MTDNLPQTKKVDGRHKPDRSGKGKVEGWIKAALDAMIWQGLHYTAAAKHAGVTASGLSKSLSTPKSCQYLAEGRKALLASEQPRNVLRLTEIRDSDRNLVASVNAIKTLEQLPDDYHAGVPAAAKAGLIIVVQGGPGRPVKTIEPERAGELVADDPDVRRPLALSDRTPGRPR